MRTEITSVRKPTTRTPIACPNCGTVMPDVVRRPGRPSVTFDLEQAKQWRWEGKSLRWIARQLKVGKDTIRASLAAKSIINAPDLPKAV